MKLKSSLRMIEFAAMLAAAGMAHATETSLGTVMPGTTFSTTISGQRFEAFTGPRGFSLLTRGDGSLKRRLMLDDEPIPLSGFTYGLFSSLTNTLVGSTYNALSKTFLYAGLVPSDRYFKSSGFERNASGLPLSLASGHNDKAGITTAMSAPQGYAMFFAGLGVMSMVVRRRARSF